MHCTLLSLARMNIDIVKLRKSEPNHLFAEQRSQTEMKGINTYTNTILLHSTVHRRHFNFLLFDSIVWAFLFSFNHFHRRMCRCVCIHSIAYCCFCKLRRTIILAWLHFGDIYTLVFSLSFDFMAKRKKTLTTVASASASAKPQFVFTFVFAHVSDIRTLGSIFFVIVVIFRRHRNVIKQIR